MANEIIQTASLRSTLSGTTVINATTSKTLSANTAAVNVYHATQEISAANTALALGSLDITNNSGGDYMLCLYNRSSGTTYVSVLFEATNGNFYPVGKMYAGECFGPIRAPKLTDDSNVVGGYALSPSSGTMYVEVVATEAGTPP